MNSVELANQLTIAKLEMDKAIEAFDQLKQQWLELGIEEMNTDIAKVKVTKAIRIALDTSAIKQEMSKEWCDNHSKISEVATLRISYIPQMEAA